jgi:hypothetical protein
MKNNIDKNLVRKARRQVMIETVILDTKIDRLLYINLNRLIITIDLQINAALGNKIDEIYKA